MPKEYSSRKINRIVIFTLGSLYSSVGLHDFIKKVDGEVVLICQSQRFGGKYGSFLQQFFKNLKRSGFSFVMYSSLHLIYFYPMLIIADFINFIRRKEKKVYTVKQLSKKFNIPVVKTKNPNEPEIIKAIHNAKPDLIISAHFDHIIRKPIIDIPSFGVINIHMAELPKYRGPLPPFWPMLFNEDKLGVTIHIIDNEELDVGPILSKKYFRRIPGESVLGADCRLFREGINMAIETVNDINNEKLNVVQQSSGTGSYYSFPSRKEIQDLRNNGVSLYTMKDFIYQFI